jgi:hypothetical protein
MSNDEVFASEEGNIESRFLYIAPELHFDFCLNNQKYSGFWPDWHQSRKSGFAKTDIGYFFYRIDHIENIASVGAKSHSPFPSLNIIQIVL